MRIAEESDGRPYQAIERAPREVGREDWTPRNGSTFRGEDCAASGKGRQLAMGRIAIGESNHIREATAGFLCLKDRVVNCSIKH